LDIRVSLAAAGLVLAAGVREWRRRAFEREVATRLPVGADGVIAGAQPIELGRGGRGLLVLHGFGDTPQSVRVLAETLHDSGWSVRVPLLPGHGRSLRAFSRSRGAAWIEAARIELERLEHECSPVAVIGQSMGAALGTIVSSGSDRVRALVLLAPYLQMPPAASRLARLRFLASPIMPYVRSRTDDSIQDPAARRQALGFGLTTPRLLAELAMVVERARVAAASLRIPTLMLQGKSDPRIPPAVASANYALLRGTPKALQWFTRSGHVISADYERDLVARAVLDWLETYAAAGSGAMSRPGRG